ncbi:MULTISPECIES: DUF3150 domain-containing protein [Methylomonas]|uniref:DUF3150 domain-containing protein n=1 Tax=Methylomonas methanica TaxID=421 RepID=A0A177MMS7_METMH|nr:MULTISPECIES: DUF3150 domain-containing protein [Methylomonas]OAI06705.1 hypothetical protein A1353_00135 [Methylomonas methanica]PKM13742.1 MAG: DUF3150 domain-containing protein [Gammaproteobacteria bacterium HGW-Gammaproteobacteria-3]QBC26562.1 DUF3150 domain-containing protein [Methylomonas sp. LW13]
MSHETQVILDRVVLVKVEANIYGARKKLKKEDLVLADGSKLPPEDLASLGSKRLLDPDKLTVFNRLKKEAERICLRVGTRFLGGFAVPVESAASITAELERIALDFAAAKTEFIAGYDAAVTDWVVRHPEFAGIIEQAVDSVEFVSTRLSFDFLVVSVGLPDSLPPADVARLESKIGSLSEQMFYEISVEANQLIEQSLLGKEQVTRNALRPIRRMRDKLDGLGFLDHRVAPVVSTIDDLLARIPNKGAIEGSILQEILATAMLLSDPDKTRRHGEGLLTTQPPVVEETEEVIEYAEPEPPAVLVAPTAPTPVIAESVSDTPDFTDLFDGIFDDELEAESTADNWALEVLLDKSQTALKTGNDTDESNPSEHSAEPETVTAGDDEEADDSDQDYWF